MKRLCAALLLLLSCSQAAVETRTTASEQELPTVSVATTTTQPAPRPTRLRGGGAAWRQTVANVYGPACGGDRALLPAVLRDWPTAEICPKDGQAASSMIAGTTV